VNPTSAAPDRLRGDEVDRFAAWITAENLRPERHVAYVSIDAEAVVTEIRDLTPLGPGGFLVIRDGDGYSAALGVESDAEVGRAWLWGPFVTAGPWQDTADTLLTAAENLLPAGIRELELAADTRHAEMATLAERHGFVSMGPGSRFLHCSREHAATMDLAEVPALDPAYDDQLAVLHPTCFPDPYFTAAQLREMHGEAKRLLGIVEEGRLLGFAFAQAPAPPQESILDFVGVAKEARGRGLGEKLCRGVMHWAFSGPGVDALSLSVRNDNTAAAALYEKLGYTLDRVAVGWRKQRISRA